MTGSARASRRCGHGTRIWSSDGQQEYAEHERYWTMDPFRKRLAEAAVLALYFIFEAHNVWPENHGWALFSGAFGTCVVLLAELPIKPWLLASFCIAVASAAIYIIVGPSRIPDVEVVGSIQAGNEHDTDAPCFPSEVPHGSMKLLLGTNTYYRLGLGVMTLIKMGTEPDVCNAFAIERTTGGIQIEARIFDRTGKKLVATISKNELGKNEFRALEGGSSHIDRNGDLSTLIVRDGDGNELAYVRYMNPTTIHARGIFGFAGYTPIPVRDDEPIPGLTMTKSCLGLGEGLVWIRHPS